jgi:hypothetical protein
MFQGQVEFVDNGCSPRDASDDMIARLSAVIRGVYPASAIVQCPIGKWFTLFREWKAGVLYGSMTTALAHASLDDHSSDGKKEGRGPRDTMDSNIIHHLSPNSYRCLWELNYCVREMEVVMNLFCCTIREDQCHGRYRW